MVGPVRALGGASSVVFVLVAAILTLFMLAPKSVLAEDKLSGDAAKRRGFEGPQGVSNQIESDRAARERDLFEIPFLTPYFAWKGELADKYGFNFAIDYTAVGIKASDSLAGTDDNATGGIFRFFGTWDLIGRGTETVGSLVWRMGHHRSYSDTNPSELASVSLGYTGVINPLHDDEGEKLNNLYWRQIWNQGDIVFIGGFHDPADFVDVYALTDPLKHFSNLAFLTGAGAMNIPSSGSLGAMAGSWLSNNFYLQGGLADSNGDPTDPLEGFDTITSDREYFTNVEIGWTTSPERAYLDNIHLTLWHVDERDEVGTEDGWGAAFSASRWLQDRFLPFLKAGYAHDSGSLLEKSVSIGIGYQPQIIGNDADNILAIGFNWGEPNSAVFGSGLDDQYSVEAFYRWQLTREIAVTPNIQYIRDPALNPEEDNIWLIGLRARFAF